MSFGRFYYFRIYINIKGWTIRCRCELVALYKCTRVYHSEQVAIKCGAIMERINGGRGLKSVCSIHLFLITSFFLYILKRNCN